MPQMAPMMWLTFQFLFLSTLILLSVIIFFFHSQAGSCSTNLIKSPTSWKW